MTSSDGWGIPQLYTSAGEVLTSTMEGHKSAIGRVIAAESDLQAWFDVLMSRPEHAELASARRDFGYALYAGCTGLYRMAFASLRSFLEVAVFAIRMSASEYERRRWTSGKRDLHWSDVTAIEDGLYSTNFVREFAPEVTKAEQIEISQKMTGAYRVCSEYLHGNIVRTTMLPERLIYNSDNFTLWLDTAADSLLVVHHSLFLRYHSELPSEAKQSIEPVLESNLTKYISVRVALGLPVEQEDRV